MRIETTAHGGGLFRIQHPDADQDGHVQEREAIVEAVALLEADPALGEVLVLHDYAVSVRRAGAITPAPPDEPQEPAPPAPPAPPVPPVPLPTGAPEPGPGDRILFDTQGTLQRCTSLAAALELFAPDRHGEFGFTTDMDGRGTHALRVGWRAVDTCRDAARLLIARFASPYPRRLFISWKMHMGRTATGGGIGEVGRFQITNAACGNAGRKLLNVLRDVPDRGSTGRVDLLWNGPAPTHPSFAATNGFQGNLWAPYDPDALVGRDVAHTVFMQAESAPGAGDGVVRLWVDGVLVADHSGVKMNADGFQRFQFPSTFAAPSIDMSEYFWDIAAWEPA